MLSSEPLLPLHYTVHKKVDNRVGNDIEFTGFLNMQKTGLILVLHPSNERRRYKVALSPIGWAQT